MKAITAPDTTQALLDPLDHGGRTIKQLEHGGYLFLEHDIPFLLIYFKKPRDKQIKRLARTGASYIIIGEGNEAYFKAMLQEVTQKMSRRFRSFLLVEIYGGDLSSREFVIRCPTERLPSTLKELQADLSRMDSRRYYLKLTARVEHTNTYGSTESRGILDASELRTMGGTIIGIEIPLAYRDEKNRYFPVYFKQFRGQFAKVIQKAAYEFIRVQTTSKIASYHALGKRQIHDEVIKIDRTITKIQNAYSFLLLVAPVNIRELKTSFFASDCTKIDTYHYRLLPVDPDLLKRKLYNLDIDEIDDPALAYIYDEKREEIDQELTMLKERGSTNFFYSSLRMFKTVSDDLYKEARLILQYNPEEPTTEEELSISAQDFKDLAEKEYAFFKKQSATFSSRVHIRDDVNIMMVSSGELYLPSGYRMKEIESRALIQHEIGTHVLTYYNGKQQPLQQLASGLAGYDALQEGLAVLAEYLADALCCNRLRTLAGRVVAGRMLQSGASFHEMFKTLHKEYGFTKDRSFSITSRMFQGGGFMKDIVYLQGLLDLREHLKTDDDLMSLLSGKFALKHLDTIKDLTERNLLQKSVLIPRYFNSETAMKRLHKFKEGIPLYKMIHQ